MERFVRGVAAVFSSLNQFLASSESVLDLNLRKRGVVLRKKLVHPYLGYIYIFFFSKGTRE